LPFAWDNCEILCREPDCPSFAPERYDVKGVHTYPVACLYRSRSSALHVVGDVFHLGNVDGADMEFPVGWTERILHQGTQLRFVSVDGRGRAFSESGVYDTARLARALARVTQRNELRDVTENEIREAPRLFHGQLVRFDGVWSSRFERSSIAEGWLTLASEFSIPPSPAEQRVRVTGLWLSEPGQVYGHLGGYPAEMLAYDVELSEE
jgi:hypothetical protein